MAQLFDISKVTVGPRNLEAVVSVSPGAPLMTSEDPEGTELVLGIMPGLADHMCLGDASSNFGEVVADTELAHLLEHVTVELLAQTDAAGDVTGGQTVEIGERTYEITLACPDDVLVAGALSSAAWILQWAYSGGGEPEPDVEAIASGLVSLVESLSEPQDEEPEPLGETPEQGASLDEVPLDETPHEGETMASEFVDAVYEPIPEDEPEPEPVPATEPEPVDDEPEDVAELAFEPAAPADVAAPEPAPADDPEPAPADPEPAEEPDPVDDDPWGMKDVPRPRLVR